VECKQPRWMSVLPSIKCNTTQQAYAKIQFLPEPSRKQKCLG